MSMKKIYIIPIICALLGVGAGSYYYYHNQQSSSAIVGRTIETFYGPIRVHEPVLLALIDHPAVQRLKKIRQYGVAHYFCDRAYGEYNRYDHSVGVFALLRQYGSSLPEQKAGLLNEATHTVFSHVGAHIFDHHNQLSSYQDDIHAWYLEKSGIGKTLEAHGFSVDEVLHKSGTFYALEQNLPDICADRLEYNLQGGVLENLIDNSDVQKILDAVIFENNKWIFTDAYRAKQLARISLYLTEHQWGSPQYQVTYDWAAEALKRMVQNGDLSFDDIHFVTDDDIWQKLCTSKDSFVTDRTEKIRLYKRHYYLSAPKYATLKTIAKFRGINPLIKTEHGLKRLTEIDSKFNNEYETVKQTMERGWYIALHDENSATPAHA